MQWLRFIMIVVGFSLLCPSANHAQNKTLSKINKVYDSESDKTAYYLEVISLPSNNKKFSVGGAFEANGKTPSKMPCCMTIVFTSIGKKKFDFEDDHKVTFSADGENLVFDNTTWKESNEATAFVLAGVAFPEEIWIGMTTQQFLKIANAKTVNTKIGNFRFTMTKQQQNGLIKLSKQIQPVNIK